MFQKPTPIVINLIIINVVIFLTGKILDTTNVFLSLHYIESSLFNPVQFFSYMFVHADESHIFFNMLGLFVFGPVLERYWGGKKFLIYYIVCGIGAGMLYSGYTYYEMYQLKLAVNTYITAPTAQGLESLIRNHAPTAYQSIEPFIREFTAHPTELQYIDQSVEWAKQLFAAKANVPMEGASGAIYAILLGVGYLFPYMEIYLLFPPLPLKMVYLVIFYGVMAVYGMVQQQAGDNVAHFAHLSGMIVGFVLLKIWKETRPNYY